MSDIELWAEAERWLSAAGDASAGEWRDQGTRARHIRRRITTVEGIGVGLGPGVAGLCDVRGTPEHEQRIAKVRPFLPAAMRYLPTADLG